LSPDELDAVRLERQVQEVVNHVGCALMREGFERADETAAQARINGQLWGHRRPARGTYRTLFGEFETDRSTYQQSGRGRAQTPLELRLGIVEGRDTPVVARDRARLGRDADIGARFDSLGRSPLHLGALSKRQACRRPGRTDDGPRERGQN
jgi:hypothetical protein